MFSQIAWLHAKLEFCVMIIRALESYTCALLLYPWIQGEPICDWACENQPCERKLHVVTFL